MTVTFCPPVSRTTSRRRRHLDRGQSVPSAPRPHRISEVQAAAPSVVRRSTPGRNPSRGRGSIASPELLARIRHWMEREITFVSHPMFDEPDVEASLIAMRPASLDEVPARTRPEPGLAFVAAMVQPALLSVDEETYLFTQMNFLKWRAEQNRQRLTLNSPDEASLVAIESDLNEATVVRNQIVHANLRLVVALSKKLAGHSQPGAIDQMSELISEGTLPLIRAVELFDISLGNRFSTYATWAVRNQMYRLLKRSRSLGQHATLEDVNWFDRLPDHRQPPQDDDRITASRAEVVQRLLAQLTERERLIVAARFGLNDQPHGQSLQEIADQMSLSKERVRQIVISSLERLEELTDINEIDSIDAGLS
jgi:RNA polymerase primary sigma factor